MTRKIKMHPFHKREKEPSYATLSHLFTRLVACYKLDLKKNHSKRDWAIEILHRWLFRRHGTFISTATDLFSSPIHYYRVGMILLITELCLLALHSLLHSVWSLFCWMQTCVCFKISVLKWTLVFINSSWWLWLTGFKRGADPGMPEPTILR